VAALRQTLSLLLVGLAAALAGAASAANIPPLTGRVVDQAGLLSDADKISLETRLEDLEAKSGIQLVVATVKSLEGEEIEPYANQMFRAWKLGERTRNNGVLLLVAPNERRVRMRSPLRLDCKVTA